MRNFLNYLSLPVIAVIILYVSFGIRGEPTQREDDPDTITLRISGIWGHQNLVPGSEPEDLRTRADRNALIRFQKQRTEQHQENPAIKKINFKIHMGMRMEGPGNEAGIMMALAAGTAGEILYTNFRSVDSFVQQGFYLELDEYFEEWFRELLHKKRKELSTRENVRLLRALGIPETLTKEDLAALSIHELDRRDHDKLARLIFVLVRFPRQAWDVIYRKGPDGVKHVYAIPFSTEIATLAYRKDLFAKAGLNPDKPPRTWDELLEYSEKLADPANGRYAMQLYSDPWRWLNLVWCAGSDVVKQVRNPETGEEYWKAVFNDPGGIKALDYIRRQSWMTKTIVKDGRKIQAPVFLPAPPGKGDDELFQEGTIAMRLHNPNDIVIGVKPMEVAGIAPLPRGPDGIVGNEVNCATFAINASVRDNPTVARAAWDYLKYMASEERARAIVGTYVAAGEARQINPYWLRKFYPDEDYDQEVDEQWEKTIRDAMEFGVPEPHGKNCRLIYDTVKETLSKAVDLKRHSEFTHADLLEMLDMVIEGAKLEREADAKAGRNVKTLNRWSDLFTPAEIEELRPYLEKKGNSGFEYDRNAAAERTASLGGYSKNRKPRDQLDAQTRRDYNLDRLALLKALDVGVHATDVKLLEYFDPAVLKRDRKIALVLCAVVLGVVFFGAYRIARAQLRGRLEPSARQVGGRSRKVLAGAFLAAALLSILLWQYLPLAAGSGLAFMDYSIAGESKFVGFDNFIHVMHEKTFWISLRNTFLYVILSLGIGFFLPIILAVLLTEIPRFKLLLRTIYFLPAVTSGLVIAFLWMRMYDPGPTGFLNTLVAWFDNTIWMDLFGADGPLLGRQDWLMDKDLAMLCVIIPVIWAGTGPGCIIYLAALKAVPEEIYEAADIDGAGAFRKFFHITLPTLKPLIIINFVGAFIGSFRAMENVLVMTGGDPDNATRLLGLEVFYNAFGYLRYGYATAVGWIMGSLLVGFTLYQLRILRNVRFTTAGRT